VVFCATQSLANNVNLWKRHCRDGVGWWWRWLVAAMPLAAKTLFSARLKSSVVAERESRKAIQRT
jgi:hypothetical protein